MSEEEVLRVQPGTDNQIEDAIDLPPEEALEIGLTMARAGQRSTAIPYLYRAMKKLSLADRLAGIAEELVVSKDNPALLLCLSQAIHCIKIRHYESLGVLYRAYAYLQMRKKEAAHVFHCAYLQAKYGLEMRYPEIEVHRQVMRRARLGWNEACRENAVVGT